MARAKTTPTITSFKTGILTNGDTVVTGDGTNTQKTARVYDPKLLEFVPPAPNGWGSNYARSAGWDTLSAGSVPGRADTDALFGIISAGSQDVTNPNLSCVALLYDIPVVNADGTKTILGWKPPGTNANKGSGTARRITLSATPGVPAALGQTIEGRSEFGNGKPSNQTTIQNCTFVTWVSAAFDAAMLFADGSSAYFRVSADPWMQNQANDVKGSTGTHAVTGDYFGGTKNVGPNIRRLVQLGYR